MTAAALPFGLAMGLLLGALGGSGSLLAIPILVYAFGEDVHEATTQSLVIVGAGAWTGAIVYLRRGLICRSYVAGLATGAVPGAFGGTAASSLVGGGPLVALLGVLMLVAGWLTWRREPAGAAVPPARQSCPPLDWRRALALGGAVGFLTGLSGVGGGFLIVPALVLGLGFSIRVAIPTSLAVVFVGTLSALAAHLVAGRTVDAELATAMGVACICGTVAGAVLATHLPSRALTRGFASVTALVAVYLLISVVFLGGPPTAS